MDPLVHLLIDGAWIDVATNGDVDAGISMTSGRSDEQSRLGPCKAGYGIKNNDGTYSPRNPLSQYFGRIGLNTPDRVSDRVLFNQFGTNASNGWGTGYTTSGGLASAYSVSSGTGRISVSAVNSTREVYSTTVSMTDSAVRCVFRPGVVTTGGGADAIQMAIEIRRLDVDNYYYGIVSFETDSNFTVLIGRRAGGAVTALAVTAEELPYTAGSAIAVDFTACGDRLELRAWDTADPTAALYVAANDSSITLPGNPGVRVAFSSGVTNALPVVVQYDDLEVLDVRHSGEIPAWPPRWDVATDVRVPIESSGITRRLGQGAPILKSALRRYLEALKTADADVQPVAGWLMEEGTFAAQGLPIFGSIPLLPFKGQHTSGGIASSVEWGKGDLGPSFPPVLSRAGSAGLTIVYGRVKMPFLITTWHVDHVFSSGTGGAVTTLDINPNYLGSTTSGWPQMEFNPAGNEINVSFAGAPTSADVGNLFDGLPHYVRLEAVATGGGANTTWTVYVDGAAVSTATEAGWALAPVSSVALVSEAATGSPVAQGYLTVWSDSPGLDADVVQAGMSWAGEAAGIRIQRLCAEEGIACVMVGDPQDTGLMGPQRLATLLDLLNDCETVDQGILFEPRGVLGIGYRPYRTLLNQDPKLELDYTDLAPTLDPTDDDQQTRNDVTATQALGGESARWTVESGPLSVHSPPDGVWRYETSISANVHLTSQLRELASWTAHLGTWDEARYPQVSVNFQSPTVRASSTLTSGARAIGVGDVGTIDDLPAWLPPDQISFLVRGSTEFLDKVARTIAFNCTPAGPYTVGVWDESRYESSTSSTVDSFVSGTDTSMLVSSLTTPWVTGSGSPQFPFDIGVSGARLTVTEIESVALDAFGRVVANSWGTPDTGPAYTQTGGAAGDYSVASGVGRHSMGSVNVFRSSVLDVGCPDVQLTVDMSWSIGSPTGAGVTRWICGRWTDTSNYYAARMTLSTAGVMTLELVSRIAGVVAGIGTSQSAGSNTAADWWRVTLHIAGSTLQATARNTTSGAPEVAVAGTDTSLTAGDSVAFLSRLETGNTNVTPIASWDLLDVQSPQTFTITQTPVNGVAKTIPAGSKVSLWTPARYAL